jgi:PAS domain S-box-containing protein
MDDPAAVARQLERERAARLEAEQLLEIKSLELWRANDQLRRLFDQAGDAIFVHNETGQIIEVNARACQTLGYTREELLGMNVTDIESCPPAPLSKTWETVEATEPTNLSGEHRRKDGTTFPVEVRISRYREDEAVRFMAIVRDVTARARAEQEASLSRDLLRQLATELALSEEQQRRAFAVALHDEIGQPLAVTRQQLQAALQASGPEPLQPLTRAMELINGAIHRTRSLTTELSPPILYELGFVPAIEALGRQARERHELAFELEVEPGFDAGGHNRTILLYQIVRELIINAFKHAQASALNVRLSQDAEYVIATVADDGVGFDPASKTSAPHAGMRFGLFSIRERLKALGGNLTLESYPDSGTNAVVLLPCPAEGPEGED